MKVLAIKDPAMHCFKYEGTLVVEDSFISIFRDLVKILILRVLSVKEFFHIPNNFFLQYIK